MCTFDIGQNDLGEGFFENKTIKEVNASVPDIITKFSTNIQVTFDNNDLIGGFLIVALICLPIDDHRDNVVMLQNVENI